MGRLSDALTQAPEFDGKTFNQRRDGRRLNGQLAAVHSILSGDYRWYGLRELATRCSGSEAGVSARIRDLRKPKFGGHIIQKRCVNNGLWEYRLLPMSS